MKKNITKKDGIINIELIINGEEWKKAVSKSENKLVKDVKIPGFRKGKVDPKVAKKSLNPYDVYKAALDSLLDSHYQDAAMELAKVNVISKPEIQYTKASESEGIIKISAVLYPEIKLPELSKLKAIRKEVKVSQKDIEQEFENFKKQLKDTKIINDKSEKIIKGDVVNIDFVGKIDNKEFPGGSAKGHDLEIGSKSFIDNFEDQLIGLKVGDKKNVSVTFPKDYQAKEFASKKAVFEVSINSIKRKSDLKGPELQKRLEMFGFSSMDNLKSEAGRLLKIDRNKKANEEFRIKLIQEIIDHKETKIDVPKNLIDVESDHIWKQLEEQLKKNNLKTDAYLKQIGKTKKQLFDEQILPEAKKRLLDTLIISEIARVAKIEISDKELEKLIEVQANEAKIPVEQFKTVVKPEMVRINAIHDKVLDYVSKKNKK